MAIVTLFRKEPGEAFDAGTVVNDALATGGERKDAPGEYHLSARLRTWHLWAAQTGSPPPKLDDYLLDANGDQWFVEEVKLLTLGTRYRVETRAGV